jgi:hypothetical protein
MMYGHEKSDLAIVAEKPTNKAERSAAEPVERRAGTKGNAGQLSTCRTQCRTSVTQGVGSHAATYCRRYPRWEKLWDGSGGGYGTFIVLTSRWRLPRAASQRSQPKPGRV